MEETAEEEREAEAEVGIAEVVVVEMVAEVAILEAVVEEDNGYDHDHDTYRLPYQQKPQSQGEE